MNTNTNRIKQWQEQEALSRFQLIAPLLQEDLDTAKRLQLRKQIAQDNDISVRSIYRYEKAYREGQFAGLKPAAREKRRSQKLPENFDLLLEQAVQLRKEVPERSVAQIICILELEGYAAPGVLKRSTLERHLYRAGYGREQMQMYRDARGSSSKRFCKPHRMMLVQGDISTARNFRLGKMVPEYRRIFPLQSMTIPAYCWLPVSMTARRKPLLRIRSARRSSDTERLMPATLITVPSISPDRSGSLFQDWGSGSSMQNRGAAKAKGRLKSSIR